MLATAKPSPSATSKTRQKKNGSGGARSRRDLFSRPDNRRRAPAGAFQRRLRGRSSDWAVSRRLQRFAKRARLEFDSPPQVGAGFNASGGLSAAREVPGMGEAERRERAPMLQDGALNERSRQLAAWEVTSKALAWVGMALGAGRAPSP